MSDSNLILHWEINNASAAFATGKVESIVFDKGGFKWTAAIERRADSPRDKIEFSLRCDSDHNGPWKCEAEVGVHFLRCSNGSNKNLKKTWPPFSFDANCCRWMYITGIWSWNKLTEIINVDDKATVEFRIYVVSTERGEPAKFATPNRMSNVILKIGDGKLHVFKELLALHSPVFETLFFGNFAEKGKEEVELKDVVYEEFVDLLHLIYPGAPKITDHTVQHLLKLADQFQMEGVLKLSNEHLMQSGGLDVAKKLLFADQYRLVPLRDLCLQLFTTSNDMIQKLMSSPEYANFSDDMKARICDRIMQLNVHMTDNSDIVLHWEIDNATVTLATGKAESGVFNEGGYKWKAAIARDSSKKVDFTLQCDLDLKCDGPWKCEVDLGVYMLSSSGRYGNWIQDHFIFNSNSCKWAQKSALFWFNLPDSGYKVNNKVTTEFRIMIISSERPELVPDTTLFTAPNHMSNIILKIGDEKLHVSKELLALHSPVFNTLFFGNFAEKGKEEVELKDVVYERVLNLLTNHLMQSKEHDIMKKLLLADQYRLISLKVKDHCINSFTSATDLTTKLKSSPECANFSDRMQAALLQQIIKLT